MKKKYFSVDCFFVRSECYRTSGPEKEMRRPLLQNFSPSRNATYNYWYDHTGPIELPAELCVTIVVISGVRRPP